MVNLRWAYIFRTQGQGIKKDTHSPVYSADNIWGQAIRFSSLMGLSRRAGDITNELQKLATVNAR